MNYQLKIGIVGFGGAGIAQCGHFTQMDGCEVAAVYDPKNAGLTRARHLAPNALVTDNFQQFIACDINAVAICSPDRTHADYLVRALEAQKHVICEKPLADSADACRRILSAEERSTGVVAAVQHQMRFVPVHVEMKRQISLGKLGRISYIEGYYIHNLTTRASLYDDWRFADNATPLVYSGCHFVDLLRWLLEDEVEEVMGMANNIAFPEYPESDLNVILLRFKSGVIGKVVVAFGAARPQDHSVRVYGSEMSIENNLLFSKGGGYTVFARPDITRFDGQLRRGSRKRYSIWGRGYIGRLRRYRRCGVALLTEWLMRSQAGDPEYGVSSYPFRLYPHGLAVRASLDNFARAVRGEEALRCSLRDAAKTVMTCVAGVEAYRTGKTKAVEDL